VFKAKSCNRKILGSNPRCDKKKEIFCATQLGMHVTFFKPIGWSSHFFISFFLLLLGPDSSTGLSDTDTLRGL
jgi:hypothetical protein